jgi:hypothetical protein
MTFAECMPASTPEKNMSENQPSQVGPERIRIDVDAEWEMNYWTRKLGVSTSQLAHAIAAVGDKAHDIVVYFRQLELQAQAASKPAADTPLAKVESIAS